MKAYIFIPFRSKCGRKIFKMSKKEGNNGGKLPVLCDTCKNKPKCAIFWDAMKLCREVGDSPVLPANCPNYKKK